jgi:hypothetical protein
LDVAVEGDFAEVIVRKVSVGAEVEAHLSFGVYSRISLLRGWSSASQPWPWYGQAEYPAWITKTTSLSAR